MLKVCRFFCSHANPHGIRTVYNLFIAGFESETLMGWLHHWSYQPSHRMHIPLYFSVPRNKAIDTCTKKLVDELKAPGSHEGLGHSKISAAWAPGCVRNWQMFLGVTFRNVLLHSTNPHLTFLWRSKWYWGSNSCCHKPKKQNLWGIWHWRERGMQWSPHVPLLWGMWPAEIHQPKAERNSLLWMLLASFISEARQGVQVQSPQQS